MHMRYYIGEHDGMVPLAPIEKAAAVAPARAPRPLSDGPLRLLLTRNIEHVNPMHLFAGVYSGPSSVHEHLRSSVDTSPVESPADGSLCSDSSPISMSGQGLHRARGAIPSKPWGGRATKAILRPLRRHPVTVPERHTK